MNLLTKSSHGYRIMDRSKHTVRKYLNDEKTHAAINIKLFKKLNHVNNALDGVELSKAEIEYKNQSLSCFSSFNTQTSKVGGILQLFHQILWYGPVRCVGYGQRISVYCACRDGIEGWCPTRDESACDRTIAPIVSKLMKWQIFRLKKSVTTLENMTRENLDSPKRNSDAERCYAYVEKPAAAMMLPQTNLYSVAKLWTNGYSSRAVMKPWEKNRWVLEENIKDTSINSCFRTTNHLVETYEQIKKGLSSFYPKKL